MQTSPEFSFTFQGPPAVQSTSEVYPTNAQIAFTPVVPSETDKDKMEALNLSAPGIFQDITMDQTPTYPKWRFVPMYREAANGGTTYWIIGFDGIKNLLMLHGYVNGTPVPNATEVVLNTSGRSMQEQALLEARQRYTMKFREGYRPPGSNVPRAVDPMLAHKYEPPYKRLAGFQYVYIQPKLDGIRMLVQFIGGRVVMTSRGHKEWNHITHVVPELTEFFAYLPADSVLDGELYDHDCSFNTIQSLVTTKTASKIDYARVSKVKYNIFDINLRQPISYDQRYSLLVNAYTKYVQDRSSDGNTTDPNAFPKTFVIVPSELASSHEQIMAKHNEYVAKGYEGLMIKKIAYGIPQNNPLYQETLYVEKRSYNIMKLKIFDDEEAVVVGVKDSNGTEKGCAMLTVRDIRGNVFDVRMRGSFERRKMWLQNPQLVYGRQLTIRFFGLSEYGVPRHPVGVRFRDYE